MESRLAVAAREIGGPCCGHTRPTVGKNERQPDHRGSGSHLLSGHCRLSTLGHHLDQTQTVRFRVNPDPPAPGLVVQPESLTNIASAPKELSDRVRRPANASQPALANWPYRRRFTAEPNKAGALNMTTRDTELVQTSFAKVALIADQAAAMFYVRLFELGPSPKSLFQGDMAEQGKR